MTADLQDEHTTSTQASELLETETAERIRLEKELQDILVNVKWCTQNIFLKSTTVG